MLRWAKKNKRILLSRIGLLGLKPKQHVASGSYQRGRGLMVFGLFFIGFFILATRAVTIHTNPPAAEDLARIADRQYTRSIELSPYRGVIYDRRQEPLAISIRKPSFAVNPRVFSPTATEVSQLARILNTTPQTIEQHAQRRSYFSWLRRKVARDQAAHIRALNIDGLYEINEPARFYPLGSAAAHLLGYVNIDDLGLMGIERQFNDDLKGHSVRLNQFRDARGRLIFNQSDHAAPEQPGKNIHLTIDRAIQEIAERALVNGVVNAKAKAAYAIVADPHTGRILAMASHPTFDPNRRNIDIANTRNRVMLDMFEPGSVIKTFVVAEALEQGIVTLDTEFDCEGGRYHAGGVRFGDARPPERQHLSVAEILVSSSNVCTYKIAKLLGEQGLFEALQKYGFNQRLTATGFPGQSFGYISDWQNWRPIRFANISFGQGMMATSLELVQAFSAIANGGKLVKPHYVAAIEGIKRTHFATETIKQATSPEVTRDIRQLLFEAVEYGAFRARLEHHTAGGKTGTSQKVDPETRAYSRQHYHAIFAGIAPIIDPHIVVVVVIDEPNHNQHFASLWAAPVFQEIASQTLRYLNVAPDRHEHSLELLARPLRDRTDDDAQPL